MGFKILRKKSNRSWVDFVITVTCDNRNAMSRASNISYDPPLKGRL